MTSVNLSIYIDDSGQLHPKYKSDYFIYGGYYCLTEDVASITNTYGRLMKNIYRTRNEVKTDKMKDKHKRKVLRRLLRDHENQIHPIFVATYVPKVTIDFSDKESVQLHKNYILRRLVEDVINDVTKTGVSLNKVSVYIDNQSQTNVRNRDSLENYIKKYFSKRGSYLLKSFTTTDASITVEFLDSKTFRAMQIADFFANTKYCRYEHKCEEYKNIYDEFSINPLCRKHPQYFTV
ncbi:DUF3800 domain-containing protein [Vagococcus lutrae]|uniref:DUF3800 domain-containing protein n=1 Tax=Vagococcus lutrae TaxID=81947 RepID=UPI00209692A8|nr:DUF3800 domain-containing protein [Vagococcus lutrae]MCO7150482.1 DUF3800 domain-containing protein [Vagococcus lutrae]